MCGIVGLFLKDKALEPLLGAMISQMLGVMNDRGPDSAGFAVYGIGRPGLIKTTLRGTVETDFAGLVAGLGAELGEAVSFRTFDSHCVVSAPADHVERTHRYIGAHAPSVTVVCDGARMEIFKETGLPSDVAKRFSLEKMTGTYGIGHTRMATESAVTTKGAHPFSTGTDQCLVHNGSLSNHNSVRRDLRRHGIEFATDNDSEVAAAYLTKRMQDGDALPQALNRALADLDGFYTFVVGTAEGIGVLRDPIACKPAVMAETKRYVAFGSEYRALVDLPGIEDATVWEPEPATVYFWQAS